MYFKDINGTGYYNESGVHLDVNGSGSTWYIRLTPPNGSAQDLYDAFATEAAAQAVLDKFVSVRGVVDFSVF